MEGHTKQYHCDKPAKPENGKNPTGQMTAASVNKQHVGREVGRGNVID